MKKMKIADKTDWKTYEMPEQHTEYTIEKHFPKSQMECLRFGHIPEVMEDKWFWYMEGQKLYAHRSWTGICVYILTFNPENDVIKVIANRNPEQYKCTDDSEDKMILNNLLDWWSQENYDYYHEWLSETLDMINKQKYAITKDTLLVNNKTVDAVYFHKPDEPNGFLSNWWESEFVLEGIRFTSVEQCIMYRKCMLFGDMTSAQKVLATNDTEKQQNIGRYAHGYNEMVWNGMRQVILMRALVEKFAQDDVLKEALLNTGDAYLVECANSDKIWACGEGLYKPSRKDISLWSGKNILGFTLMEVRRMFSGASDK